jgi:predicted DNA-binding mobile mystery protein A
MTSSQLARRIGIERSGLAHFQNRERAGTISLESMQRIASALECDLVYAFVPRAGSFEATVRTRARIAAARELAHAAHTMALEEQPVQNEEHQRQLEELTGRLIAERPSWIWDDVTGT